MTGSDDDDDDDDALTVVVDDDDDDDDDVVAVVPLVAVALSIVDVKLRTNRISLNATCLFRTSSIVRCDMSIVPNSSAFRLVLTMHESIFVRQQQRTRLDVDRHDFLLRCRC
jgi:hypothetical protein